jgi:hypothetical protein
MAEPKKDERFKERQRVAAAVDLPGVPAGTKGKVFVAYGLTWPRYRVVFDNGVELGLLDGAQLELTR